MTHYRMPLSENEELSDNLTAMVYCYISQIENIRKYYLFRTETQIKIINRLCWTDL